MKDPIALTFALSNLEDGRGLAHGLICAKARYASVAWLGAERLDRRWVELSEWRMLELALLHGIPNTPLESTHVIPHILLPADRRKSIVVQLVASLPLDIEPTRVAEHLDTMLRSLDGLFQFLPAFASVCVRLPIFPAQ